jgi:hypothetical protein
MIWLYNGEPFSTDEIDGHKAFVYIITNIVNGKKYIGAKRLQFIRRKRIKDSKRRRTYVKESDWADYYGSSEALAKDLVKYGKESFRREILRLCKTNVESRYYELKEQMDRDVLFYPAEFYNNYVGARIHRNHVLKEKKLD